MLCSAAALRAYLARRPPIFRLHARPEDFPVRSTLNFDPFPAVAEFATRGCALDAIHAVGDALPELPAVLDAVTAVPHPAFARERHLRAASFCPAEGNPLVLPDP